MKTRLSKTYGMQKSSSKREVYNNTILPQETRKISNKQPNLTSRSIRERRTKKVRVSRRKEIINIRSEKKEGFPGGTVVENLSANAGDTGSSPGLRRSHVPQSSWAHEPQLLSLHVWSLCSATREAAIVRGPHTVMKSGPHSLQLEKALTQK